MLAAQEELLADDFEFLFGAGSWSERLAVIEQTRKGVDRTLVTCDDDNAPSARTIETCGGVLEDVRPGGPGRPGKRRYWIAL